MKILFIDAYFYPEKIAFSHLERDILNALVENENEIEVICPVPTRGITKNEAKEYKKIKHEKVFGVNVTRFWAPRETKNPIARAVRYLWCNLRTYHIAKKIYNVDIIFAASTPPTQGFLAAKIAKKNNCRFVYSLQDIFPDSMVNVGMTKNGSLLWKIGRRIEDYTYKNADKIIVISDSFKENILKKGVSEDKIEVIPNWADTDGICNIKREDNKVIKKYSLNSDRFYITYCGNIGHSQDMDMLLDAAKETENLSKDILFIIIGEGASKTKMQERIENEHIKNVIMLPFQPYEDIAHVFSMGDMGLIISKRGIGNNSVPSKTWGYMAAERPILCSFDEDSELCKIIKKAECGFIAEAGNKEALISQIETAYRNKDKLKSMGLNGLKYLTEYNDRTSNVARYACVVESCIKESNQ